MDLRVRRYRDAASFLERAEPWLLEREAEHTLLLGIAARLQERTGGETEGDRGREPVYLATVEQDGAVAGCAFRTPPHKVGLTRMPPEAVPLLVEDMAGVYDSLPAVAGPDGPAEAFGRHWAEARGVEGVAGARQRIHVLAEVEPLDLPPGAARPAAPEDRDVLVEWWRAFEAEADVLPGKPEAAVDRGLGEGRLVVWDDGGPRSFAGVAARTTNGVRIGPVYTPPEHRGRGYATALVADLSRRLLEEGCSFCCLYTDLANPTSNAIYRRIGYRPLLDVREVVFVARGASRTEAGPRSTIPVPYRISRRKDVSMPPPAQYVSAETPVPRGHAAAPQRLSAETPVSGPHAAAPGDGSAETRSDPATSDATEQLHTATLGGGCFWCLEAVYQELEGVASVRSGYAGGHVENPTYQQVCAKGTGHAEVVQVRFDPEVTSYRELLQVFFTIHDPTTPDRQGADVGPQYRSIILTGGPEQERVAREVIAELEETGAFDDPVVTEVKPLDRFWPAEQAHHDYYRRNQNQPYCRIVIDPKLAKFRKVFQQKRRQP